MNNVLISAAVDAKQVKTLKIMGIIYLILVFPLGILLLLKGIKLGNQKIEVSKENIKVTCKNKTSVLPIDSISGVEHLEKIKGISLFTTTSQQMRFEAISNAKEVVDAINDLINGSKSKGSKSTADASDSADQLAKYKKLLDSGVISKEEFDAKKKQLLDL